MMQHMEIGEFENREETDDENFLIQVLYHKTSPSTGKADIISPQTNELIEDYLKKIRKNMEPKSKCLEKIIFNTY